MSLVVHADGSVCASGRDSVRWWPGLTVELGELVVCAACSEVGLLPGSGRLAEVLQLGRADVVVTEANGVITMRTVQRRPV